MSERKASLPTETEWMRFKAGIETLRDEAFAAAVEFFPDAGSVAPELVTRKAAVRFQRSQDRQDLLALIAARVPDCYDYLAYHVLIGSTIKQHQAPKLDLPDDLSVTKFYQGVKDNPRSIYLTRGAPAMILHGCDHR